MKNYYEILGIDEEATQEEIRARWAELTKLYHPDVLKSEEVDDRIKEINEAYQVLKDYSARLEYDLERALRHSVLKKTQEKKKPRWGKIFLSAGVAAIAALAFIASFFFFSEGPPMQEEPIKTAMPPTAKLAGPESPRVVESKGPDKQLDKPEERHRPEKPKEPEKPVAAAKVVPKEAAPVVVPGPPKVVEVKKPEVRRPPEKGKEPAKPVETAKVVPREAVKAVVPVPPKVVEPKKPEERRRPEKPKAPEKPAEVAKVVPKEAAPVVVPVPSKVVEPKKPEERSRPEKPREPEKPVAVAKVVPKEAAPVVVPEPPKVVEPKKPEERRRPEKPEEPAKPVTTVRMIPKEPSPVVEPKKPEERPKTASLEEEAKKFFAGYTGKYNQRDVEGFLSFFSTRAVQNQKDGMNRLKTIYANFFDRSRELRYQLKDMQVEPYPNGLEVKARYELNQVLKEGGERKSWRGQARWVLVKEGGAFKILSLEYQHQK